MAPLLMQILREKSRSLLIYVLFAILIIVFIFTFNTSGGSGGCSGQGPGNIQLAQVGDTKVDFGVLQLGMELTPDVSRGGRLTTRDVLAEATRFYRLAPVPIAELMPEAGQLADYHLISMIDRSTRLPIDSAAFEKVPQLKYAGFRRSHTKFDKIHKVRVLNDLVESYLVANQAKSLGIKLDPKLVEDRVLNELWFDPDTNEFLRDQFKNFIDRTGVSSHQYTEFVHSEMLREKMIEFIASQVTVSDDEIERLYVDHNDKVKVEYVEVDPEKIAPLVPVSADEIAKQKTDAKAIEKYYNQHKSKKYVTESKVQVRALLVAAPSKEQIDAAKDDKAKKAMQTKLDEAQKKASEIRTKIADATKKPAPLDPEKAEDGANAASDTFKLTKDAFVEAVKSDSADDNSKRNDGLYAGTMTKLRLEVTFGKEIANTAIALKKGTVTEPISGNNGLWILLIEDTEAGINKSLADSTEEIATILARQNKAPKWAEDVANTLLKSAQAAPKSSLKEIVTAWNEAHRPKDAAATQPGGPAQDAAPKDAPKGAETKTDAPAKPEAKPEKKEEAKTEVKEEVKADKPGDETATQKPATDAGKDTEAAVENTNKEATPAPSAPAPVKPDAAPTPKPEKQYEDAARIPGADAQEGEEKPELKPFDGMLVTSDSPPIARANTFPTAFEHAREQDDVYNDDDDRTSFDSDDDSWLEVPGFGKIADLKNKLFGLTTEKPVLGTVVKLENGNKRYVVRLKERLTPEGDEATAARTRIRRQLLAQRQREAYRAWYAGVLAAAKKDGELVFSDAWEELVASEWKQIQTSVTRTQPSL